MSIEALRLERETLLRLEAENRSFAEAMVNGYDHEQIRARFRAWHYAFTQAERIQYAVHEAGHAVVGEVLGFQPERVEISAREPQEGGSPRLEYGRVISPYYSTVRFRNAVLYAAGPVAEELVTGILSTPRVGDSDMNKIEAILPARRVRTAFAFARKYTAANHPVISRVACELLVKDYLNREDLLRIFYPHRAS